MNCSCSEKLIPTRLQGSNVSVATFTKHAFQQSTHGQIKIIIRKQKKTQRTQDATERTPRRRGCEFNCNRRGIVRNEI